MSPWSFDLNTEIVFWVAVAGVAIGAANLVWLGFLAQKINRLLGGSGAKNIEQSLVSIHQNLSELKTFRSELEKYLESVERRVRQSVQSVETLRFNPFKGTGDGGNQSFATSFIDENGDGVVVSSLYSRERVSIFSKPVKGFASEFELTEEEQTVVDGAKKKLSSPVGRNK
jgi:hypothetical protein